MNPNDFERQMNRMHETYGSGAYPQTRVELIWCAVRDLSAVTLEKIFSRLIGEYSKAPMMPQIREVVSEFRERAYLEEKKKNSQESVEAFNNLQTPSGFISFRQYVNGVIETQGMDSEEYRDIVKAWGEQHV